MVAHVFNEWCIHRTAGSTKALVSTYKTKGCHNSQGQNMNSEGFSLQNLYIFTHTSCHHESFLHYFTQTNLQGLSMSTLLHWLLLFLMSYLTIMILPTTKHSWLILLIPSSQFKATYWSNTFNMITCSHIPSPMHAAPSSLTLLNSSLKWYEGGLISLWLYKENNKLRDWEKMYLLYIFPPELHTLMTSLF
jgi:hypothetical protein